MNSQFKIISITASIHTCWLKTFIEIKDNTEEMTNYCWTNFQLKMMVQLQIPLANRSVQEESWKIKLAEKLTGRKLGDFGEPEDIAETAAFLASSR